MRACSVICFLLTFALVRIAIGVIREETAGTDDFSELWGASVGAFLPSLLTLIVGLKLWSKSQKKPSPNAQQPETERNEAGPLTSSTQGNSPHAPVRLKMTRRRLITLSLLWGGISFSVAFGTFGYLFSTSQLDPLAATIFPLLEQELASATAASVLILAPGPIVSVIVGLRYRSWLVGGGIAIVYASPILTVAIAVMAR
ncbi:MAG: hypothetical protein O3B13_19725 [Planctomycetota bacterium]|nr:hypothetical protein [Planctomycetota bacterium]